MGSCFSAESRSTLPSSPTTPLGIKKKKNSKKRPPGLRSSSFDHRREEQLHRIAGRMFLNGSSDVASLFTQQGKKGTNQDAMIVWESYQHGKLTNSEIGDTVWKTFFQGKLTFMHWNKGEEMAPTIAAERGTLLVRKLPAANSQRVFVGDVVVLKDPEQSDNYLVRRLAAIEGYKMFSKDEKEEPFILEKDQCWVLADNENLKPKEAKDSRLFVPVSMNDIICRVLYCLRTAVDHGPIQNSQFSMQKDLPVLEVELDVDEMAKNHKA